MSKKANGVNESFDAYYYWNSPNVWKETFSSLVVSDVDDYAAEVINLLENAGIRSHSDFRNEKISDQIRWIGDHHVRPPNVRAEP